MRRLFSPYTAPPSNTSITTSREDLGEDRAMSADTDITGVTFGTADSKRLLVWGCNAINLSAGSAPFINGVTIGGVSATQAYHANSAPINAYLFYAEVPTGTSGTVNVTTNGDTGWSCAWGLWRLVGDYATPTLRTADGSGSNGQQAFSNIPVTAGEAMVAVHSTRTGTTRDITWSGTDTETTVDLDPNTSSRYGKGFHVKLDTTESTGDLVFEQSPSDNHACCYGIFE